MTFTWTPHRFSGGALALDVANTVILRGDVDRSIDRFASSEQIESFCEAAVAMCAEREGMPTALRPPPVESEDVLIDLREATDRYFRTAIATGEEDNALLADLLSACAAALRTAKADELAAATAHSVLYLIHGSDRSRMRICTNCGWLFLDRSKNRSRIWCDMAVCGNRRKASRHYKRKKETPE